MGKVSAIKIYKKFIKAGDEPKSYVDVSIKCSVPPQYWPQIAEGMGFDNSRAEDIQKFVDAVDLRNCIKTMNKLLETERDFDMETGIQQCFTDYTTSGFPWSDLHKICNGMQKQLEHRREIAFQVLFQVVKHEVAIEIAEAERKKHKVSIHMTGKGQRKTLAWHRRQLEKSRKEKLMENPQVA